MGIEVLNESGESADVSSLSRLSRFVLDRMRIHPQAELCVKLVDPETIATLNAQWMDGTGPTDVLAFPMDELRPSPGSEEPAPGVVGDVVLCPRVAAGQAAAHGQSAQDEIDLLLIHGVLHLLGFDHAEPEEHREMFGLQARLLGEWQGVRRGEEPSEPAREQGSAVRRIPPTSASEAEA
ncbi:MAG: rRNA maturation RNase YbeY [Propionibacteriales bacterium]|nr:rRNA maturation RNase YbeY [Propionibacteriales bacterium]